MIKGFDDQLRIQRLGKIRLGVKKTAQSGSEYPSAVDYFVCPPEVQRVYGEKPRELEIMLPHDAIEEVFPTALKRYGSGQGLMCRGNGEKAECRDADSEEWYSRDCLYEACEHYESGDCKEVGNLQVILPEVKGALGIYQIDTSSYNSIMNIKSGLEMLRSTVGRISLIPLTLEVRMQEANPMTSKGRIRTNVPVMFLRFDHTFYEVLDMAKDRQLVQQINTAGMAGPALQVDNEGLDEKPELLYPNQLEEGKDAGSQAEQAAAEDAGGDAGPDESKEDEVDDPRLKRARNLMERLGWPPAKQKAVLGKPDLNVQELLEGLRAEVAKRHKEQEPGTEPETEPDEAEEPAPDGPQLEDYHTGNGWYDFGVGDAIRGKDNAQKKFDALKQAGNLKPAGGIESEEVDDDGPHEEAGDTDAERGARTASEEPAPENGDGTDEIDTESVAKNFF